MAIPPDIVQKIKDSADILEVVQDFLNLTKKGNNYWAHSPFTNEKTPSFSVSPSKGIFKCFSSGKGGDAITYLMEAEQLSYPEALRYLAEKYNIEIKEEEERSPAELEAQQERERLLIIHDFAAKYYQNLLQESEDGKAIGLTYFKERGLNAESIERFGLGFSSEDWEGFSKAALAAGFSEAALVASGLSMRSEKTQKLYDRFRGRVIFPIHNLAGRVIAFGGRVLGKAQKQAKYLNSPETAIYHKSNVLYGISQAKRAIRSQENCYLVEGYTDVIALSQIGIENVLASSGTSLTAEQCRLIKRFSENVTLLFDGDPAGIKAALRGVDLMLEQGLNVRVVTFPAGEDPDSYSKNIGAVSFKKYLKEEVQDFITFKASIYQKDAQNDPLKRAEMVRELVSSIIKIPDPIKQEVFYQACARLLNISEQLLMQEGQNLRSKASKNNYRQNYPKTATQPEEIAQQDNKVQPPPKLSSILSRHEQESIRLLLKYGKEKIESGEYLTAYLLEGISDLEFETPLFKRMLERFRKAWQSGKVLSEQDFIKGDDREAQQITVDLISERYQLSPKWESNFFIEIKHESKDLQAAAYENILRLKLFHIKRLQQEIQQKIEVETNESTQDQLLRQSLNLEKVRKEIAEALNNIINP